MHHLLCVHGIGTHANNWTDSIDDGDISFNNLLKELWEHYFPDDSFDSKVKVHSIHYDDEIKMLFNNWEEQAKALKSGLASSHLLLDEIDWFTEIIDSASATADEEHDDHWKYSHLMDLLLFVGSPTIQKRLVTYVGAQVAKFIAENFEDNQISVIGHSMGTAILHKVIKAYFNEGFVDEAGKRHTASHNFMFNSVIMVANTSYTLSRDKGAHYEGIARPSLTPGKGSAYQWFNINHQFDPVGQFLPFNPKGTTWLDPSIKAIEWFKDIELELITSKSIHSINHYFRDPAFHIPFFNTVFAKNITKEKINEAVKSHATISIQGGFAELRSGFLALSSKNANSFKDFYQNLIAFQNLIENFKDTE